MRLSVRAVPNVVAISTPSEGGYGKCGADLILKGDGLAGEGNGE
jgi:uncharacterized low-complexity protein